MPVVSALEGWKQIGDGPGETRFGSELKAQGFTQRAFSRTAKLPLSGVKQWAAARYVPNGMSMLRAAQVLDCDVEHLWRIGEAS